MDWTDFPPLLIVTGTVHVHGGETRSMSSRPGDDDGEVNVRMTKKVAPARKKANVVAARYQQKIDKLRIIRTPFGSLVQAVRLAEVKKLLADADEDVKAFNADGGECSLWNCIVWEPLRGNRLAAVKVWLDGHPDDARKIEAA